MVFGKIIGMMVAGGGSILFANMYGQDLKGVFRDIGDYMVDKIAYRIIINPQKAPKLAYSIKEALEQRFIKDGGNQDGYLFRKNAIHLQERGFQTNQTLNEGYYNYENNILIYYSESSIIIMTPIWNGNKDILACQEAIKKRFIVDQRKIMFYTIVNKNWSEPIIRNARIFNREQLSISANKVLSDVATFFKSKTKYEKNNYAYRKGYLLAGPAGVGKSQMAEIIASKYDMQCLIVCLNAKDMTDALLIHLLSRAPKKSLIIFDEIDHQLDVISENNQNQITAAGLLTAIDGPQRLNEACIVLMTTNNLDFLDRHKLRTSLIRDGRIDQIIQFD